MNVLVIQNSERSGAGYLGEYLVERRHATLKTIRPATIADECADGYHLIVVLGCAHAAYEDLDWIHRERAFVGAAIALDIPMIGVCFGAQLIASAIGGRSEALGRTYSGWYRNDVPAGSVWFGPWLRWHGDEISLPPQAEILAKDGVTIQAFQFERALGVQFHPEAGAETLNNWIEIASAEKRARIDAAALVLESAQRFAQMTDARDRLFSEMLARIGL